MHPEFIATAPVSSLSSPNSYTLQLKHFRPTHISRLNKVSTSRRLALCRRLTHLLSWTTSVGQPQPPPTCPLSPPSLTGRRVLKKQKDVVSYYLHSSSDQKLLEKVQHELLSVYATQLLEKEGFGCHALLMDDKVDDLSRMFRLFSKIPHGLDPVSSMFKQHVAAEGTTLVKQAEDAANNKKTEKRDMFGLQE